MIKSEIMKRKVLILLILLIPSWSVTKSQKVLTLKQCYDLAASTSALAGEKESYSSISGIRDNNLSKGWLPSLDANASAAYNSDVVDFKNASIPGIGNVLNSMPHEQYKITLDINQVIYDGGAIKSARALEKADLSINEKQTETDLYKVRAQINNYYFNILLLSRQRELLNNYLDLLRKRISSLQSGVNNGVILRSDIDVLASEQIKIEQQLTENSLHKTALNKILSDLTGVQVDDSTMLIPAGQKAEMKNELLRPELQLFDLRKDQLTAGIQAIQSKRMPKAFGFATLGYGNPPGSDFFNNTFDTYYIVGGGIKWNIFDYNKAKNEKQVISIQQGIIEKRKIDLEDNLNRQLESKTAEIKSLEALVQTDSSLIVLRKRITLSADSQYRNGTITATEYLNEMNSEQQAMINYEIHKLNLALAKVEYLNISGQEVE
jgi:outer membrane protein TolC